MARTEMLIEMSRLVASSAAWGEPAEEICFAAGTGQDDGFDPRAGTPGDPASIARLQDVDSRFTPAASCTVTDYWFVTGETGAPAHMLWIDSLSTSGDKRIWGTVVVGPALGQTRGYVCTIREPRPQTIELTECVVAWFN